MSFGNRAFAETEPNPFYTHHTEGPVTYLIGNVLRQAYSYGQTRGQVLLQQDYPYDVRNLSGDLTNNRGFTSSGATTRVGVARGWVRIPREMTHLVCDAVFAVQSLAATEVSHRLIARNGTGCDRNDYSIEYDRFEERQDVAFFGNTPIALRPRAIAADFPYLGVLGVKYQRFDLALSNVGSPPGICQLRIEALANRTDDGSTFGSPVAYLPLWYQVAAESRY